ncbi:drug/metabolite transporter (DMT)-like permease [Nakamurella sp. UYEF19]|uniref:DMT family transporter n=1 Tax=Nakamurella sp. UYEF19 TaxID=1756392 RepID=UPI00339A447F
MPSSLATTGSTTPAVKQLPRTGVLLCLVSGAAFGAAAVFAKESFAAGWSVSSLLTVRFVVASVLLWTVVAIRRPPRPSRRAVLLCVALGAIGYALQSATYFGALTMLGAGVVAQLVYVYPALVFLMALVLRRESLGLRKVLALGATSLGLVLLLQGGGGGSWSALGVLMALSCAVIYAIYITIAATFPETLDPVLSAAIICSAAAASLGTFVVATDSWQLPTKPIGWLWMLAFAVISTVVSIITFLAGLRRVGPSAAAILSCVEPVVTAVSSVLVYGEHLSLWQIAGGVAVLASVVLLQLRRRSPARNSRTEDVSDRDGCDSLRR